MWVLVWRRAEERCDLGGGATGAVGGSIRGCFFFAGAGVGETGGGGFAFCNVSI